MTYPNNDNAYSEQASNAKDATLEAFHQEIWDLEQEHNPSKDTKPNELPSFIDGNYKIYKSNSGFRAHNNTQNSDFMLYDYNFSDDKKPNNDWVYKHWDSKAPEKFECWANSRWIHWNNGQTQIQHHLNPYDKDDNSSSIITDATEKITGKPNTTLPKDAKTTIADGNGNYMFRHLDSNGFLVSLDTTCFDERGNKFTFMENKGVIIEPKNGLKYEICLQRDGKYCIKINGPALPKELIIPVPEKSTMFTWNDGTIQTEQNGNVVITWLDGRVQKYKDNVYPQAIIKTTTWPDGTIATQKGNGPSTATKPDGTVIITTYGEIETTLTNGTKILENKEEIRTTNTDKSIVVENKKNGRITTTYPDGRVKTHIPYPKENGQSLGHLTEQKGPKPEHNYLIDGPEARGKAYNKQKELEKVYGVTFSKDTDPVYEQDGKTYACRLATYAELIGIEQALMKSQPVHKIGKDKAVKFTFLNGEQFKTELNQDIAAFYSNGDIYITSGCNREPWLDTNVPAPFSLHSDRRSFMATIMHELSHNSQREEVGHSSWDKGNRCESLAELFGFERIVDQTDKANKWVILAAKMSDGKNNDLYKATQEGWVHVDKNAYPLGKPMGDIEMYKLTKVKQPSLYFTKPVESYAEALTQFSRGNEYRARLKVECPEIYKMVKDADQKQIDKVYGPGWVRDISGFLVKKTTNHLKTISQFEEQATNTTKQGKK